MMTKPNTHNLCKSAALDFVELRIASHSNSCYSTHSHDEFSFGVVDSGSALYKNSGNSHQVMPQSMVTINPGDAHSCNPNVDKWSYRMLFIDTQWIASVQKGLGLPKNVDYMPFDQQLLMSKYWYSEFSAVFNVLLEEKNPLAAESYLINLCAQLFAVKPLPQSKKIANLHLAQELLMDRLDANLSLDDLSKVVNISPYHLIRSFKQRYGQSPHAYQLDQRIKRARILLKTGESLATVANLLGFADQSHFQRNFKKRTALTPRQYQQFFV